jgi:hypothetical protein
MNEFFMSMETGEESLSAGCSVLSVSLIFLVVYFAIVIFFGLIDIVAFRVGCFIGEPPP